MKLKLYCSQCCSASEGTILGHRASDFLTHRRFVEAPDAEVAAASSSSDAKKCVSVGLNDSIRKDDGQRSGMSPKYLSPSF